MRLRVRPRGQVKEIIHPLSARAHNGVTMERLTAVAGAADVAAAIDALSDIELVRLKALARLWSRNLPVGLGWSDILHEAITRVLDGSRPWPPDVPVLAFLSGVMRSICNDHWRRARLEQRLLVSRDDPDQRSWPGDEADEVPDPERVLAAAQMLTNVYRPFERAEHHCKHGGWPDGPRDLQGQRHFRARLRHDATADATRSAARSTELEQVMTSWHPSLDLARLLEALSEEIVTATDEEVRQTSGLQGWTIANTALEVRSLIIARGCRGQS